jgi:energy-converting hydrogenase Eha subunit A
MTPATAKPAIGADAAAARDASYRLVGLLVVSLFPALFWTTVIAVGAYALSIPLNPLALATVGAAIAALLAGVFSALTARI